MEIRDKIAEILQREETEDLRPPFRAYPGLPKGISVIKADQILALFPSLAEWEVVRECQFCDKGYVTYNANLNPNDFPDFATWKCNRCYGTGEISRSLT